MRQKLFSVIIIRPSCNCVCDVEIFANLFCALITNLNLKWTCRNTSFRNSSSFLVDSTSCFKDGYFGDLVLGPVDASAFTSPFFKPILPLPSICTEHRYQELD